MTRFCFSHGTEREAIERYDPGPVYAEAVIEGEYNEARSGNQKWEITIKVLKSSLPQRFTSLPQADDE